MIGSIRGRLIQKQAPDIVIEAAGVGYEIQVPMTTLFQLPAVGEETFLLTHFVVRDDAQLLYGFIDPTDRLLFRQLIKVSGVGPKLALAILSGMDAVAFARCIERNDLATLVALPGVGKKTAERLIVEMRDRLGDWLATLAPSAGNATVRGVVARPQDPAADAESALVSLGYKPQEAARMIQSVRTEDEQDSETLIRLALRASASQ
ncbi:MAG: Holliday junction branch migration protein RuvA [Proteobacteria bacterium]|nr:Holliday junction branch migration protein RuvA [Pseudomonadota bacterium]MDA0953348.1 Holliday junction branch migration protein RuvA [Pseudomonadota bacterium]